MSCVVSRIQLILSTPLEVLLSLSPVELVQRGFCDPVKIFIKTEPHTAAKIASGKLRIISNVSIVDQLVERLLFSRQNKAEIANWEVCPSKPGMGLHDAGMAIIWEIVQVACRTFGLLAETDVSGWDWSVPAWLLKLDMECRILLCDATPQVAHLMRFRAHAICNKVFALSDGSLIAQTVPGIQASGSYNTSSTNSRMRVLLAWLGGCLWAIAMGDDNIETVVPGIREWYERMGFKVKDYKTFGLGAAFEFCSTRFSSPIGVPVQWLRTVYRYVSHSPPSLSANPEFRAQLADDLRHHPDQESILSRCDRVTERGQNVAK